MRLITFTLSFGIALTCIPACASAQSNTFSQATGAEWVAHCPKNEGYVDWCHAPPAQPTAYSSKPAPSQRAYGSLWRPSRARLQR
jgi:hypothetical protein